MKCKFTKKKIKPFMSFGKMPIANGFLEKKNFRKEFFYDLDVGFSKDVCLLQIANCQLPIAYCLWPIAYRLSPIAYCLLHMAYCLFCLLPSAYCLLHIAC